MSITSAEEQAFVASLGVPVETWIGGFQANTSNEPAGGWTWIDGEPWSYTNWGDGEPNNANIENCLHWRSDNAWNDIGCALKKSDTVSSDRSRNSPASKNEPLSGQSNGTAGVA